MKRRKFIVVMSSGLVASSLFPTQESDASVVDFYVLSSSNYSSQAAKDEEIYLKINELIINTLNITNTDEKAEIKFEAKYSDKNTYQQKASVDINLISDGKKDYSDKVPVFKIFEKGSNIEPKKLVNEFSVRVDLRVTITHTDIENLVENTTVSIGTTSRGEIATSSFPTETTQYIQKSNEIYSI